MNWFLSLIFVLCLAAPAQAAILPQICWEQDVCPGTFQGAFPSQNQSFFAYLESDQTVPGACGTFWFVRYDSSVVQFVSADTVIQTGVGNLTFEVGPATPGGSCTTCDEKLTLFWTDIVNDGIHLPYRIGPEIRVEFNYIPGMMQQIVLDGIYAEQYSYAPGCLYVDLGLMNQITVPEPSLSATLLVGVLGLGAFFRSR